MRVFYLLLLCTCVNICQAQQLDFDESNTYALVVGISTYADKDIKSLNYAHHDAEVFAEFLQTTAGGSVPKENIRLLTNEKAVLPAIDDGFDWLLSVVKEGDLAILYFSGHGDVEKQTDWQLGYLLTHNTPFNNYRNQAVRLEDLNLLSLTLSTKKNVRTLIILDACRAGKLSGRDNLGPSLTFEQASKQEANEVRILSCKADQESWESEEIGGGRGVFSYYLINGLYGMADTQNPDGKVSVEELAQFIKPQVRSDAQKLSKGTKNQDPIFVGDDNFLVSKVDPSALVAWQEKLQTAESMLNTPAVAMRSVENEDSNNHAPEPLSSTEAFFGIIQKNNLLERLDYSKMKTAQKGKISAFFMEEIFRKSNKSELPEEEKKTFEAFEKTWPTAKNDPTQQDHFNRQISIALHNRGQEVLNLYLKGDTAELSKRGYFSDQKDNYDKYPEMFEVAMKMLEPGHPSYHKLKVKYHYFAGVAARIKMVKTPDPSKLIQKAKEEQLKALALDDKAAYIHNELGILYRYEGNLEKAEQHYLIAADLAPTWAIPWSNLTGLYADKKELQKAAGTGEKAKKLQPTLQGAYNNLGRVYEETGDRLHAEELFLQSINLNQSHFYPYERLGFIYLFTTRYALADTLFYESELRKKGLFFPVLSHVLSLSQMVDADGIPDIMDDINFFLHDTTTVLAQFYLGMQAFDSGRFDLAESRLKRVIDMELDHPLAYHYAGVAIFEQKRYEEAEIMLRYAQAHYLDSLDFEAYCKAVAIERSKQPSKNPLTEQIYRDHYYREIEDYYWLADLYEAWRHYEEAENIYLEIIEIDSLEADAYRKLWTLYEFLSRFNEAENLIETYVSIWEDTRYAEFSSFYNRMIERFPQKADWYYKLGLLNYEFYYIGIEQFEKVLELEPDYPSRTDIHIKLGHLYYNIFNPDTAALYFEKAIAFEPEHANPRMQVADIYHDELSFQSARVQLEYLYAHQQINYPHRLRLAEYIVHSGRYAAAERMLTEALEYDPKEKPEKYDLLGRLYLMSGQNEQAIQNYRKVLSFFDNPDWAPTAPETSSHVKWPRNLRLQEMTSPAVLYSIARANAVTAGERVALASLEKALDAGFTFQRVLRYDQSWDNFRQDAGYQKLMKKYFPQGYPKLPSE